jgi:hypothetical protein
MTIDERLDRLTERHQALTQSIELMITDDHNLSRDIEALKVAGQQDEEKFRALAQSIEMMMEDHRDLGRISVNTNRDIEALKTAQQDGENIRALLQIAERRLSQLEGQE